MPEAKDREVSGDLWEVGLVRKEPSAFMKGKTCLDVGPYLSRELELWVLQPLPCVVAASAP